MSGLASTVVPDIGTEERAELLERAVQGAWIFLNAVIVLWMQVGFAMLEVGSVRVFYVQNILIKNVVDGAITIAMYFLIGFALADEESGDNGFAGDKFFLLRGADQAPHAMERFILAIAFASSSVTIVSGALAERCKLIAYFIFSACMAGFIYPLLAHWVWSGNGWLSANREDKLFPGVLGYLDYAGSSVVHAAGGTAALIAVVALGPRHGRFGIDGAVCELRGSVGNSGVYRAMGALILFVSFLSFNASSVGEWNRIPVAGLIGSNTAIAASFGCFTVMAWKLAVRNFQVHIMHCIDGLLAGCVAITAGAGLMNSWAAAVTGMIGGVFYVQTSELMLKFKLDDVVNAVAIHMSPGVWGVIAIGFFARPDNIAAAYSLPMDHEYDAGIIYGGRGKLLGVQCLGALVVVTWVTITVAPLFYTLKYFNLLRIPVEVQSGFKSSENYSWKRYPEPKIISIGAGASSASSGESAHIGPGAAPTSYAGAAPGGGRAITSTPAAQFFAQGGGGGVPAGVAAGQWGHEGSHRASRLVADRV